MPLAWTPRTVENGVSAHRGPHLPAPPEPGQVRGGFRDRGGTSIQHPLPNRAPSGRKHPAGPTGRGSGCPAALGHLPTGWHLGAGAVPDTNRQDPASHPGKGLARRPGDQAEAAESSQAGPGGGSLRAGPRGSSPFRGLGSSLVGQANHRGPMTTRPDPSLPGPRKTTEGEPEAASLLSPPTPLQQQLPGSIETPVHLGFPQRPALRDDT